MTTDMATTIDPDPREAALDVEYPIQLAYTREPVMCLAGTVSLISLISPGRRDLALSDMEWQDLELLQLSELQEQPESPDSPELPDSPDSEDVADGE